MIQHLVHFVLLVGYILVLVIGYHLWFSFLYSRLLRLGNRHSSGHVVAVWLGCE
jgi:hypothetical protein